MKITNKIFDITFQKNIPLYSVFELTYRCNLKCLHCYIPENHRIKNELSTYEVKNILRQLKSEGCLFLVFTGGEVFLRNDFLDICSYARKLKFNLRIFTNGTLIDRKIVQYLSKIGIGGVEVSLYGREKTHNKITQTEDSFQKVFNTIKMLIEYKIPVTIKSLLMRENFNDYNWLMQISKKFGIKCKFDPVIVPRNDGDKSILKYQITNSQMRSIFSDKRLFKREKSNPYLLTHLPPYPLTRLLTYSLFCSAGRNFVGISPEGKVYPCIQFLYTLGDLRKKSFKEIWFSSKRANYLRNLKPEDCNVCFNCEINNFCRRCPGLVYLETGSIYGKSEISCRLADVTKVLV